MKSNSSESDLTQVSQRGKTALTQVSEREKRAHTGSTFVGVGSNRLTPCLIAIRNFSSPHGFLARSRVDETRGPWGLLDLMSPHSIVDSVFDGVNGSFMTKGVFPGTGTLLVHMTYHIAAEVAID